MNALAEVMLARVMRVPPMPLWGHEGHPHDMVTKAVGS